MKSRKFVTLLLSVALSADEIPLRRQGLYSISGQKLSDNAALPRGIYIQNGVKVVK